MRTLNDYFLTSSLEAAADGGNIVIAVPDGGTITEVWICGNTVPTGGNSFANIYVRRGSTETTVKDGSGSTLAPTLTADVDYTAVEYAASDNEVAAGDYIRAAFNSAPTGGMTVGGITVVIRR